MDLNTYHIAVNWHLRLFEKVTRSCWEKVTSLFSNLLACH